MCMKEAMRIQPPAATSVFYDIVEDVKLGKYEFKKGDMFVVNFHGTGHNPTEWQRPTEFLPERFDHANPLSLTPDGKKRSSYSWTPFHGGNRVCFGKTLAEGELKLLATFMGQKFDFEFEDAKYTKQIPIAQIDQSHSPAVWLKLTTAKML